MRCAPGIDGGLRVHRRDARVHEQHIVRLASKEAVRWLCLVDWAKNIRGDAWDRTVRDIRQRGSGSGYTAFISTDPQRLDPIKAIR